MRKITKATIEPLKMGCVKSTGEVRAAECRIIIEYEDGQKEFHHVDTRKGGINMAYQIAQERVIANMKQRGVA